MVWVMGSGAWCLGGIRWELRCKGLQHSHFISNTQFSESDGTSLAGLVIECLVVWLQSLNIFYEVFNHIVRRSHNRGPTLISELDSLVTFPC